MKTFLTFILLQRTRRNLALLTFVLALALLAACAPEGETSRCVQLVLNTEALQPSTTFELRFDQPVIAVSEIGKSNALSPLLIAPKLRGHFTWLSQRSGVFTPLEPTRLATTYCFTVRPGLKSPDGRPLDARLRRTLRTPEFAATPQGINFSPRNVPPVPEIILQFNADVSPDLARPYLEFRDATGRRMPVLTTQPQISDAWTAGYGRGFSSSTWSEQFSLARRPPSDPLANPGRSTISNHLVVTPVRPLPLGDGWQLIVSRDLPAAGRDLRLPSELVVRLGNVIPLALTEAIAHNGPRDGKRISLRFSKPLSPDLRGTNVMDWISVTPAPPNFATFVWGSGVELRGDFSLKQNYRVTTRAGLSAEDTSKIALPLTNDLTFVPLPPRLYLPAFATEQLASGRRVFEIEAINTGPVRVRPRQLDRHSLIHALRGFQRYFKHEDGDWNWREPFRAIDFNLIAGPQIFDRTYPVKTSSDIPARLKVAWDDVLGAERAGAVFLQAEHSNPDSTRRASQGAQALVQVTDLGLAWKIGGEEITLCVFSLRTGQPVPAARLNLLTDDSVSLAEKLTGTNGLVTLPLGTNAVWILAEAGTDLHAARLNDHAINSSGFGVPVAWRGDAPENIETFLFTDRTVYRPGETVHLKAIARERTSDVLNPPREKQAELRLRDPRGDVVFRTNLVFSEYGSLDQSVVLPEGVRGDYAFELSLATGNCWHRIQVADFQANAFNVTLDAREDYTAGEALAIPLTARYYLGAPLTRAKVSWSLEAADAGFAPDGFGEFQFTTGWLDSRFERNRGSFSSHGEGEYRAGTNFILTPEVPFNPRAPQPRRIHLRAELTDLNQQTIAHSVEFLRHSSDFYLGLKTMQNVLRAGEPLPLRFVAVGSDAQPWPKTVPVNVAIHRIDHQTLRYQGAGRSAAFRTEITLTNVLNLEIPPETPRRLGTKWSLSDAPLTPGLVIDEPGEYLVEARAMDDSGREVLTAQTFYLAGPQEKSWAYRNETQITLVPDRASYRAGDKAILLVQTPISGTALVTVERERVMRSFVTELRGNAPAIEIPIDENDAPNVFVSVMLWRGVADDTRRVSAPDYRIGYCELRVESSRHQLNVAVSSDAPSYRPGDYVQASAQITDTRGQPVPEAEVTLYAVDEGILSLTGEATPDPLRFFVRPRPLAVTSGLTLPHLLTEDPERLQFGNKGFLIGGGGRERLRKDFLPCAFWSASLLTDREGRVRARFPAPDNLTRYRLVAVAHTRASQFGSGATGFEINKPLMIEPSLPRFANVTDRLQARAVVLNRTDHPGDVVVTLQLDATASLEPKTLTNRVHVPAKSSVPVEFPIQFHAPGTATWIWKASFDDTQLHPNFRDSVQSTLPVGHVAPLRREIHLARTDAAVTNLLSGVDPQILEGRGTITVNIANTRLAELGEAASQLLHYPYGCVEQTSSSLLPWITLRQAPSLLPALRQKPEAMDMAIRAGVQRLFSMQNWDGGLGYWPGARESMPWGSAYGAFVLALAQRGGVAVPAARFEALLKYLREQISGATGRGAQGFEQCLALYALALAGRAEPSYHELLFKDRDGFSTEARALLALAILESNGPDSLVTELLGPSLLAKSVGPRDDFGCGAREQAIQLLAWTRHRPSSPAVDRLATELAQGRLNAHWGTTQGNAWALYALTEYARRVEGVLDSASASIRFGGTEVAFQLSGGPTNFTASFANAGGAGNATLRLENPERRRLYVRLTAEGRSLAALQPRQDRGFGITRQYEKIDDTGGRTSTNDWRVGDRVLVTLTLDAHQPARYVAVDDPLPALFEAVNSNFVSQEVAGGVTAAAQSSNWWSDFHELRNDRVLFFRNHLEAGRHVIRYLARVRAAGAATAPSVKVEEMYHPERFGFSESAALSTRGAEHE